MRHQLFRSTSVTSWYFYYYMDGVTVDDWELCWSLFWSLIGCHLIQGHAANDLWETSPSPHWPKNSLHVDKLIRPSLTLLTFPSLRSCQRPSTCSLTHLTAQSTLFLHTWAGTESDIFQQSFVSHQSLLVCVMGRKPGEPPRESSRSWEPTERREA